MTIQPIRSICRVRAVAAVGVAPDAIRDAMSGVDRLPVDPPPTGGSAVPTPIDADRYESPGSR